MLRHFTSFVAAVAACAVFVGHPARADVEFLGTTYIDGKGSDASGLTTTLEDGTPANVLDGIGSGIAYTGYANRYLLLDDRGPSKNAYPNSSAVNKSTSFPSRFQIFDLPVTPQAGGGYAVSAHFVDTRLLTNEAGQNFLGISSAFTTADATQNLRLRPESIRVAPDGSVYVSDEYGPSVYHFSPDGRRIGAFAIPSKFQAVNPAASTTAESSLNVSGRVPGKALEGLAITPDGSHLLAAMQAPLIQDGGDGTRYTRMMLFDTAHPAAAPKEFLYKLDPWTDFPGQNLSLTGVSDMVAINDHQFLVDERDGTANQTKHAYVIDISAAQDISNIPALNALSQSQIDAIIPVAKNDTPLIDLVAKTGGLPGDLPPGYIQGFPDKIEGYAFGPDLPDGRHLLLVTNDDDFAPSTGNGGYPNYIMAFAIDPADLPDFQPEQFSAPEPSAALTLTTIAAIAAATNLRRRRANSP
jgi:hypothetical protein